MVQAIIANFFKNSKHSTSFFIKKDLAISANFHNFALNIIISDFTKKYKY